MEWRRIMDDYDFRKIDREMQERIDENPPPEFILIPVGEYNGVDLPDVVIDENYIVWLEIPNPELNCEIVM
jgi:hypothetical protein